MSIYHAFVQVPGHGTRCYEVCAASDEAAKREAMEYGRVTFVQKICPCRMHTAQ